MSASSSEDRSPQEARLSRYLGELREDPPHSDSRLVVRISRHARWQRAVRAPLLVVGNLASAVIDGLGVLFGTRGRHLP